MQTLLLIAHGSRRESSNQEVRDLAKKLAHIAGDRYQLVVPAFLELAEPDISGGVDQCVAAGADQVTIVPYFLSAGRHVAKDIPEELENAHREYPHIPIQRCDYLGLHESIPEILLMLASKPADSTTRQ